MVTKVIEQAAIQLLRDRVNQYSHEPLPGTWNAALLILGSRANSEMAAFGLKCAGYAREFSTLVLLGIHPVDAVDAGLGVRDPTSNLSSDLLASHPLHLASMFGDVLGDRVAATRMYDEYLKMRKAFDGTDRNDHKRYGSTVGYKSPLTWHNTWTPPIGAAGLGLPALEFHEVLDNVHLVLWYQDGLFRRLTERLGSAHELEKLAHISQVYGMRWHEEICAASFAASRRHLLDAKAGGFRYLEFSNYVRLCSNDQARDVLSKLKGARKVLGVVRSDATSDEMVTGLRALTQAAEDVQKTLLKRLGRAPTTKELAKVSGRGLVNLLYLMPWEILEPLVEESAAKLRVMLMPHLGSAPLTILTDCLLPHKGRVSRAPDVSNPKDSPVLEPPGKWSEVFGHLGNTYTRAQRVRQDLLDITGSAPVSILAALDATQASTQSTKALIAAHPKHAEIDEALRGYTVSPNWVREVSRREVA